MQCSTTQIFHVIILHWNTIIFFCIILQILAINSNIINHYGLQFSASISAIIFFLAHSGQTISFPSWMKPLPTMETLQVAQKKHSLCQAWVSKATNRVLPSPPFPNKIEKKKIKASWDIFYFIKKKYPRPENSFFKKHPYT